MKYFYYGIREQLLKSSISVYKSLNENFTTFILRTIRFRLAYTPENSSLSYLKEEAQKNYRNWVFISVLGDRVVTLKIFHVEGIFKIIFFLLNVFFDLIVTLTNLSILGGILHGSVLKL